MKNLLLPAVLAFLSWNVEAHNPLTAKVELNTTLAEGGLLNIYLSQAGVHEALVKSFDQTDFSNISQPAYKKMVVQYIKSHIDIAADGMPLIIGEGAIKLGSHQTDLRFLINRVPKDIQSIVAKIDIGKENGNHHTVFWWIQKEGSRKVVLSIRNQFQSKLEIKQAIEPEPQTIYGKIVLISLAVLSLLAIVWWRLSPFLKKKQLITHFI